MIILILLLIVVLLLIKQLQQIFKQIGCGLKKEQQNGIQHQLFDSSRLHSSSSAKFGKKLDLPSTSAEGDSTAVVSQKH